MSKKDDFIKRTDNGLFAKPEVLYQGPNARTNFDREKLNILKGQIRQDGVKQPLVVRRRNNGEGGELEVFDGERRSRCVRELLNEGHKIEWVPIVIRRASEAELMIEAAMTDAGKVKLDFVDQVNLVRMLLGRGLDVPTISARLELSDTWVRQRVDLIGLEPPAQKALRNGEIKLGRALRMAKKDYKGQVAELKKIRERRAAGDKKAGSVIPRPGKKACHEMATYFAEQNRTYTAEQVVMVFGWVNGDITTEELRQYAVEPVRANKSEAVPEAAR
jgi:ParB/RepB/Spo0J family partition protein